MSDKEEHGTIEGIARPVELHVLASRSVDDYVLQVRKASDRRLHLVPSEYRRYRVGIGNFHDDVDEQVTL